jgi:hypothetical protein
MQIANFNGESEPVILVEGPRWADVEFYGNWLLAAAKAQALWEEALQDPNFEKQVERLCVIALPHFGIAATVMLSRLETNLMSFMVSMVTLNDGDEALVEEFVMMLEMGFFALTGERYQMIIPTQLNIERVKMAALKLALTEDEEYYLHPEHLVASMSYIQARNWQSRLRSMDEDHRCADRDLLLS